MAKRRSQKGLEFRRRHLAAARTALVLMLNIFLILQTLGVLMNRPQ